MESRGVRPTLQADHRHTAGIHPAACRLAETAEGKCSMTHQLTEDEYCAIYRQVMKLNALKEYLQDIEDGAKADIFHHVVFMKDAVAEMHQKLEDVFTARTARIEQESR
jgi:hypothetical protein